MANGKYTIVIALQIIMKQKTLLLDIHNIDMHTHYCIVVSNKPNKIGMKIAF